MPIGAARVALPPGSFLQATAAAKTLAALVSELASAANTSPTWSEPGGSATAPRRSRSPSVDRCSTSSP